MALPLLDTSVETAVDPDGIGSDIRLTEHEAGTFVKPHGTSACRLLWPKLPGRPSSAVTARCRAR